MQATIDTNRKYYDEKINQQDSKLDNLMSMVKSMIDNIQFSNYSPDKMDDKVQLNMSNFSTRALILSELQTCKSIISINFFSFFTLKHPMTHPIL